MLKTKRQLDNIKRSFCAAPAPFLWNSLFFIIPLLVIFLIVLFFSLSIDIYKNKKSKKEILSKQIKKKFLYLLILFFSLLTYGLVGLNFDYYLLVYFFIFIWILIGFFTGEYFKLFKINREFWVGVTFISIVFAFLFGICYVGSIKERIENVKGKQMDCFNRSLF